MLQNLIIHDKVENSNVVVDIKRKFNRSGFIRNKVLSENKKKKSISSNDNRSMEFCYNVHLKTKKKSIVNNEQNSQKEKQFIKLPFHLLNQCFLF